MRLSLPAMILLILTCHIQSIAQTEKGRWTAGTQLSDLTYQTQEGGRAFSAKLTPSAGYFITNGFVLGAGVPLGLATQTLDDPLSPSIHTVATSVGLAPFVRYYAGSGKLKFLIGASYSYSKTSSKLTTELPDSFVSDRSGHTTTLTPTTGLTYFFSRTIGLSMALNYDITHQETKTIISTSTTRREDTASGDSKSLAFGAGLQVFFGK